MKKSTVLSIAIPLVVLHIVLLAMLVSPKHGKKPARPDTEAKPTAAATAPDPQPETTASTTTPDLVPPVAAPPAATETREGYLRTDRPEHHTTKAYPSLCGKPYQGAIVVDADSGKILFEERAAAYGYPASVTKLMTLLVVLDRVEEGKVRLSDKVAISKEACAIGGSQIYLDTRESFNVDDLLYALIVQSANDAAAALAIHVAGSVDAFVEQMNAKARELGMNSTTYHSPHGLPPGGGKQPDISTAYDLALLCRAVLQKKDTLRYTSTRLYYLDAPLRKKDNCKIQLATHNPHLKSSYPGADGLKTGFHNAGGWSIAATAQRNGKRIVSIVLGSIDKNTRDDASRKLLDKGFVVAGQGQ